MNKVEIKKVQSEEGKNTGYQIQTKNCRWQSLAHLIITKVLNPTNQELPGFPYLMLLTHKICDSIHWNLRLVF